jgi:hypothetical protein
MGIGDFGLTIRKKMRHFPIQKNKVNNIYEVYTDTRPIKYSMKVVFIKFPFLVNDFILGKS